MRVFVLRSVHGSGELIGLALRGPTICSNLCEPVRINHSFIPYFEIHKVIQLEVQKIEFNNAGIEDSGPRQSFL